MVSAGCLRVSGRPLELSYPPGVEQTCCYMLCAASTTCGDDGGGEGGGDSVCWLSGPYRALAMVRSMTLSRRRSPNALHSADNV